MVLFEDFIKDMNLDVTGDQYDNSLRYYLDDGTLVGYLDYSEWKDYVTIKMIEVSQDHRGKGIGKKLVYDLQKRYPDTEIDWGSLTSDGAKLKNSLEYDYIPNEEYEKYAEELSKIKREMKRIEASGVWDGWNELNDDKWRIEAELEDLTPGKKIIKIPNI